MTTVEFVAVDKEYPGGVRALDGVSLSVAPGEYTAVVGPSGAGKSTLLRIMAGLEEPSSGAVRIGGADAAGIPPHLRGASFVFQEPALYPHLTVRGNLRAALRPLRLSASERDARVDEAAAVLGMGDLLDRRPEALSGGEAQRVSLGRALARRPRIFLLDEPLSGLDARLRDDLREATADLHRRLGAATLHVTHDQADALRLGDRVVVMRDGRIVQDGSPEDVYRTPIDTFTARFMGEHPPAMLPGRIDHAEGAARLRLGDGEDAPGVVLPQENDAPDGPVEAGVRPEHVAVVEAGGSVTGRVVRVEALGDRDLLRIETAAGMLRAFAPVGLHRAGDAVQLRMDAASVMLFRDGRNLHA